MRCRACDCELTDYESTRKDDNGEFYDMCSDCFSEIKTAIWEKDLTISDVIEYVQVDTSEE